jgi:hypothetical protein
MELPIMEFKTGDYVNAFYKGSRFTGKLGSYVSHKHQEAEVVFSPGVTMLLPFEDMTLITEEEFENGTDAN